jgi:anti-sigma B factor antagonist
MPLKYEEYNQVSVITVTSELTAVDVDPMKKVVDELIEKKQIVDFVIDLEKTSFIDSEGLETLLWIKRRSEDLFGQIKLVNLDENCRKILEITRLEHRFECHQDLPAALKTMR